jgi:hypothetical protein
MRAREQQANFGWGEVVRHSESQNKSNVCKRLLDSSNSAFVFGAAAIERSSKMAVG